MKVKVLINLCYKEKLVKIINEGDTNGAKEVMHDDFKFLMHSSGKTLSKDDVVKWVGMKECKEIDNFRILFMRIMKNGYDACFLQVENDGNKEAVSYYKFKDGKIIHQETGATKLPKFEPQNLFFKINSMSAILPLLTPSLI